MRYRLLGSGRPIGICGAAWMRVVFFGYALFGLLTCAAHANTVTEFSAGISADAVLDEGIVLGPDGNLWFTEANGNRIGRMSPDGVVTEFSAGISLNAFPRDITVGPDGNLWFTESGLDKIGRITPAGVVTEFFPPGYSSSARPQGIALSNEV